MAFIPPHRDQNAGFIARLGVKTSDNGNFDVGKDLCAQTCVDCAKERLDWEEVLLHSGFSEGGRVDGHDV